MVLMRLAGRLGQNGLGRPPPTHLCVRVRVEIMGSQKCRIVGKSQPALIMIDPTIFTHSRRTSGTRVSGGTTTDTAEGSCTSPPSWSTTASGVTHATRRGRRGSTERPTAARGRARWWASSPRTGGGEGRRYRPASVRGTHWRRRRRPTSPRSRHHHQHHQRCACLISIGTGSGAVGRRGGAAARAAATMPLISWTPQGAGTMMSRRDAAASMDTGGS
jgi:hypothetical protein